VDALAPGAFVQLMRRGLEQDAAVAAQPDLQCISRSDVLCVPLVHEVLSRSRRDLLLEEREDYDETWGLVTELGPKLRGVLVGNQQGNSELSFRHQYGTWSGDAAGNCRAVAKFVLELGGRLREAGVQPFFGVINWDLIQDAYLGGEVVLRALNKVGAINICFCGYGLAPGAFIKPHKDHPQDCRRWLCELEGRGWRDPADDEAFPTMSQYLRRGQFWSGLCGTEGVRAGNLTILSQFGFQGYATKVDEPARDDLVREFGEWWK
jgi:hypothetical protein